jgi:Sigma-70 region 2
MNTQKSRSMPEAGSASSRGGSDPEAGLLGALRRGEESAFEGMVRSFGPRLLSVARRFLREEEDARDAVQEGFLSAYRSIGTFQGGSQISTWLHRIVVNACLMRLRSRQRGPLHLLRPLPPDLPGDGGPGSGGLPRGGAGRPGLYARKPRSAHPVEPPGPLFCLSLLAGRPFDRGRRVAAHRILTGEVTPRSEGTD